MTTRWPPRIAAFSLWALAALSAGYWLLKVTGASEAPVNAGALGAQAPAIDVQDLARALGPAIAPVASAAAVTPQTLAQDPAARMRLLGVVAGRSSGGVALISIEGEFPRPYRVGSPVDARYRLSRVERRSAILTPTQPDGQAITLELPDSVADTAQLPVRPGGVASNRLPGLLQGLPPPAPGAPRPFAPSANNTVNAPATAQVPAPVDDAPKD